MAGDVGETVRWRDLEPDPALLQALDFAELETTREAIRLEVARVQALPSENQRRRERASLRDMRKRWSERFAKACATMIANEIRAHAVVNRGYEVLPDKIGGGQETFTPLGFNKGKRIDVVVYGPLVGLQIGVSLKGLNFCDDAHGNHDKNLTGRLYELREEVSTVHDYLPRAFMAAVFFMPVAACVDKASASSFAHAVAELGARTGRLDPSLSGQGWRCDFSALGLYAPGDPFDSDWRLNRGAVRYFPLKTREGEDNAPPKRGLPVIDTTLDLAGVIDHLVETATGGSAASIRYAPAEHEVENLAGKEMAGEGGLEPPIP